MRAYDWQSKLAQVIKDYRNQAFQWGKKDCCLFVCDSIKALVGRDPAETFRGRYDTMEKAAELVREFCGGGVEELAEKMAERFGFVDIKVSFAQRGDVGLFVDKKMGPTLGVCIGSHFMFLLEEGGLVSIPNRMIVRAWRIA